MRRYRVVIPYCEPTYEVYKGTKRKRVYRAPYEVSALSKEAAKNNALDLFAKDAQNAHVGWKREPEYDSIEVELIGKP